VVCGTTSPLNTGLDATLAAAIFRYPPHYDEVLHEVHARLVAHGAATKLDLAALSVLGGMSRIVSSLPAQTMLPAIRQVLHDADEVLLAVAFVDTRGVHLLEREMKSARRVRVVATSKFDGNQRRTDVAFARVAGFGGHARLLNPKGGTTFHPKMYLARRGRQFSGVIASANLTSGLAGNFETGVIIDGVAARDGWSLADDMWTNYAVPWAAKGPIRPDELDARLYALLARRVKPGLTIRTLGPKGEPNTILAFSKTGATVATSISPGGKDVEARMIQVAYDALATSPTGQLTNPYLLNTLRVHRSSFVLALLCQLPMVHQVPVTPITIELLGSPPVPPSSQAP
jgi:hypothetical protein